jgi:protein TonB
MKYLFSILLICNVMSMLGQQDERIYDVPDVEASYPDGRPSAWFAANIIYPELALEEGVEGTILVCFIVEVDGTLTNVTVGISKCFKMRSVGAGKKVLRGNNAGKRALELEAVSKVKAMPKWNPGETKGVPCRSKFQVKVVFKLS